MFFLSKLSEVKVGLKLHSDNPWGYSIVQILDSHKVRMVSRKEVLAVWTPIPSSDVGILILDTLHLFI